MDDICSVLDILVLFISKLLDMNRQQEKHDIHCNGFTKIDRDGVDEDVGAVNNQFDIIKNELQETKYELDLKINAPSDIEKLVEIF